MILLDAWAIIALLSDEPAGDAVAALLRQDRKVGIVTINLAEALDVLLRRKDVPEQQVRGAVEPLLVERVTPIPASPELAWRAARLRATHYQKKDAQVSLADCFLLAASSPGDAIVTGDAELIEVARREGLEALPLR